MRGLAWLRAAVTPRTRHASFARARLDRRAARAHLALTRLLACPRSRARSQGSMDCCGETDRTRTAGKTIGGNVTWVEDKPVPFGIKERVDLLPIGTVCCFDNKSKKKTFLKQIATADVTYAIKKIADDFMPRIGVIMEKNGTCSPIHLGSASALSAQDLECISLIDPVDNSYVATTSLGVTHVFRLFYNQPTCFAFGFLSAEHVAQGELSVPAEESQTLGAANQTNIEATAVFKDAFGVLQMFWCGRGGVRTGSSWTRQAPFSPSTGMCDRTAEQKGWFNNVKNITKWRTCSAIVVEVEQYSTTFYFSSVYDGLEDGRELDMSGDQTNLNNKKVFKSIVCKSVFAAGLPGVTSVLAEFHGVKVEALMKIENGMGKVTHLVLGTDDEALGSLVGVMDVSNVMNTTFCDLGKNSETKTFITRDKWGTSGMAPGGSFAFDIINNGRV